MNNKTNYILFFLILFTGQIYSQNNILNKERLAQSYLQAGKYDKAEQLYTELMNIRPNNMKYSEKLNEVFIRQKKYEQSIKLLNNRIKKFPNDIRSFGLLGSTYYEMGNHNKAFEAWDEAINIRPMNKYNYKLIANYATQNRAFEKSVDILEKGKSKTGDDKIFAYDLANIYSFINKFDKAAEEYSTLLKSSKKQLGLVKTRINSYITRDDALEQTVTVLKKEYEQTTDPVFLELMNYLYQSTKNYDKAYQTILELDYHQKNGSSIFNFAQRVFREGEFQLSEKAYNYIFDKYPNSPFIPSARLGYAKTIEAKIKSNRTNSWKEYSIPEPSDSKKFVKVLKIYEDIAKEYNNSEVRNEAIYNSALIELNYFEKSEKAKSDLEEIAKRYTYSPFAQKSLIKLGEIAIDENNLQGAEEYFYKVLSTKNRRKTETNYAEYKLAQIEFWKGRFVESLNKLAKFSSNTTDDYSNDAIELEMLINTFKRDSLNLFKYSNAHLLVQQKKFRKAEKILSEITADSSLFLLNDYSRMLYSQILIANDKYEEAINELIILSKNDTFATFSDEALYRLALLYENGIKNREKAKKYYQKLLASFPNSLYLEKARENLIKLNKSKKDTL